MILERSTTYWATGVTVRWHGDRDAWSGEVKFYDDGFLNDDVDQRAIATQGRYTTRYAVADGKTVDALTAVIDVLIADGERLGIEFGMPDGRAPMLYYVTDGENPDWPPPVGYRMLLRVQAERIGWATYGYEPAEDGA